MAKFAAFMLMLSLVLFVSAYSVQGDNSPSIYDQIDQVTKQTKDAVKETISAGNTPAQDSKTTSTSTGTDSKTSTGTDSKAKGDSSTWGQWFVNKLENIGLISDKSKPAGASSKGAAQAPSPNAGPAYAPTA